MYAREKIVEPRTKARSRSSASSFRIPSTTATPDSRNAADAPAAVSAEMFSAPPATAPPSVTHVALPRNFSAAARSSGLSARKSERGISGWPPWCERT